MKITVTEVPNAVSALPEWWDELVRHVDSEASDVIVLPEMPFGDWPAGSGVFDQARWSAFEAEHDQWIGRFPELGDRLVICSRPVTIGSARHNEGFLWNSQRGYQGAHHKYYLPEEDGFFEASWYQRGEKDFSVVTSGDCTVGFLLCTEVWFAEHARAYGKAGANIVACPRATGRASLDKWIAGGRAAAVSSGAFCVSANRGGDDADGFAWAGGGWIIEPEEGEVLAVTDDQNPFVTVAVDMAIADNAKTTYPRYVAE